MYFHIIYVHKFSPFFCSESNAKEILWLKKLTREPNITNVLSSSDSEPEENSTNDRKFLRTFRCLNRYVDESVFIPRQITNKWRSLQSLSRRNDWRHGPVLCRITSEVAKNIRQGINNWCRRTICASWNLECRCMKTCYE